MRNLMPHDGSNLIIIELKLIDDAGIKSNLAARCAGGIQNGGVNQAQLPIPFLGIVPKVGSLGNKAICNANQAIVLRP